MRSAFHPEAREEFLEAIKFYEERKLGLGMEFKAAIQSAVAAIESEPSRYQRIKGDIRKMPSKSPLNPPFGKKRLRCG